VLIREVEGKCLTREGRSHGKGKGGGGRELFERDGGRRAFIKISHLGVGLKKFRTRRGTISLRNKNGPGK